MTRRGRLVLFLAAAAVVAALLAAAFVALPHFGGAHHPYGERAVRAAFAHRTANAIASVNFDQRAFDTLGEESILFAAVLGALVLLRQTAGERRRPPRPTRVSPAIRRLGVLLLPVTLLVGLYVVAHGQITPGGGFQGGVVVATALHLLYVAADYGALERLRPLSLYEIGDAAGEAAYAVTGIATVLAGSAFLANVLPWGTFGTLSSAGTVVVLNAAVGMEVACGVVVLLATFLDQALEIEKPEPRQGDGSARPGGGGG
ncbi:MnhB domain-containing protein [Streptomyces nanshensis]|uniref:Sodium:proton antiporter n=1 Tax=Streptomyces nanshensis TaxID=518642 RepID=A0A1E7L8S1_9ACTN|nr:MnhB domain-containing protein [Streptomyces nanshensis]OEV12599.1 sodium:proton antiporter [Streptomyces nanshensis]